MGIEDREVGADVGISSVLCVLGVFWWAGWLEWMDIVQLRDEGRGTGGGVLCLEVSTLRS